MWYLIHLIFVTKCLKTNKKLSRVKLSSVTTAFSANKFSPDITGWLTFGPLNPPIKGGFLSPPKGQLCKTCVHDDVIKWKHFPCYWPFVRGIHQSPVNSPHKGQWRGALMFSLICAWINSWVNNCEAGDLRRHRAHYVVSVMCPRHDIVKHVL